LFQVSVLENREMMIRLFRVSKHYGKKSALIDLTVDVAADDFVFVTGPSGAGKSTMIKLLYMGEAISSGAILVDGINLARVSRKQVPLLRRKFGIIFQDFKLIPTRTVFDNVALVLEVAGVRPREIQTRVMEVLDQVGIADRSGEYPQILSGGEQQRVAVARAIIANPKIIVADEPTGSLDPDSAARIFSLLQAAHAKGAAVIIATHDRELIASHDGRVIRLEDGRIANSSPDPDMLQ
jgi:cell division transport system ATP-binding protein